MQSEIPFDENDVLNLLEFCLKNPRTRAIINSNLQKPDIQASGKALFGEMPTSIIDLALIMSRFLSSDVPVQDPISTT